MRFYFYLDTNVYRGLIDQPDCAAVKLLKQHRLKIRLSAITILELIEDLQTCSPGKFDLCKGGVELAREVGGDKIMAMHGEFLAKHLFKTSYANPDLTVHWLKETLEFAVRLDNQKGLCSPVRRGNFDFCVDVRSIANGQKNCRDLYTKRLDTYFGALVEALGPQPSSVRGGPLTGTSAQAMARYFESPTWKRLYVQKLAALVQKDSMDEETADKLYPPLEAACKFASTILRQTLCDRYQYSGNSNDWADEAQLHYLCDPGLNFVTNDGRLCKKIQGCGQSQRVISFNELREKLECAA